MGRESMRKLREFRIKNYLCVYCGKPSPYFYYCKDCRDKRNKYYNDKVFQNRTVIKRPCIDKIENEILYSAMVERNINTGELSRELGVSGNTVRKWLFNIHFPSKRNALKINEFFGFTIY